MADQLTVAPVNTTTPEWWEQVPNSVAGALRRDLATIPAPMHRALPADLSSPRFAEVLLGALTWALGAGLPEEEWRVVATALTRPLGVGEVTGSDITWVLEHLGRHLIQDGEAGSAVYRVAHQVLLDQLRPPFKRHGDLVFDPAAAPVTTALMNHYQDHLDAGIGPEQPQHLWRYVAGYTARAGILALDRLRGMAEQWPQLRWDLASAGHQIADALAGRGRRAEAVAPTEEAVTLYRGWPRRTPATFPTSPWR